MRQDFWKVVLGEGSAGALCGFIFVAMVAAFGTALYETTHRDIASTNTPVKFSMKFFAADNVLRFLGSLLFLVIFIRLLYQYIPMTAMIFASVVIGFGSDRLALIAKKIGILGTDKLSATIASKINDTPTVNAINAANKT